MTVMIFVCDSVVTMMTVVCFPAEFFRRHLCQDMAQVDVSIKIKIKMTASVLKDCWHDTDV